MKALSILKKKKEILHDENLESWKWNHKTFFEEEGKRKGFSFDENMLLCFEKFKVVYEKNS